VDPGINTSKAEAKVAYAAVWLNKASQKKPTDIASSALKQHIWSHLKVARGNITTERRIRF